jgi:hypothetical protein
MSLAQNTHSGTPSKRSFDGGAADQNGGSRVLIMKAGGYVL